MLGIVTPEKMRALEQAVMDTGVTEAQLIERAAAAISTYVEDLIGSKDNRPRSVVAVAGPGNNGVDAIVAASVLAARGWSAAVMLVDREDLTEHPTLDHHLESIETVTQIDSCDVILDGIFGNSGRTELPASVTEALRNISSAASNLRALVVAIDCPTGTNTASGEIADTAVPADVTLCISHPKIGMLRQPALDILGELVILDIGIPNPSDGEETQAQMVDECDVRASLPVRSSSAHKSDLGGLLIVGGAPGYYGAPRLAGEAALRSGCGYVGLAIPRSIVGAIAAAVPELIYHPTSDSDGRASAAVVTEALSEGGRYDAMVIGPGLGRDEVATRFLDELFEESVSVDRAEIPTSAFGIPRRAPQFESNKVVDISNYPLVIDADALNWLAGLDDWPSKLTGRTCVLTPHRGEMARLLGIEREELDQDPWERARDAAKKWGQVVVLKGGLSCAASPDGELVVAPRLTPELATPGTGDMLAGVIGAFVASGNPPFVAACNALWVGAMAGRLARRDLGTSSVIASDVVDRLPLVLRSIESPVLNRLEARFYRWRQ